MPADTRGWHERRIIGICKRRISTKGIISCSDIFVIVCYARLDAEGEGGCSSHTEGCDGSTGTSLPSGRHV